MVLQKHLRQMKLNKGVIRLKYEYISYGKHVIVAHKIGKKVNMAKNLLQRSNKCIPRDLIIMKQNA